jgi:hypothetical protein
MMISTFIVDNCGSNPLEALLADLILACRALVCCWDRECLTNDAYYSISKISHHLFGAQPAPATGCELQKLFDQMPSLYFCPLQLSGTFSWQNRLLDVKGGSAYIYKNVDKKELESKLDLLTLPVSANLIDHSQIPEFELKPGGSTLLDIDKHTIYICIGFFAHCMASNRVKNFSTLLLISKSSVKEILS